MRRPAPATINRRDAGTPAVESRPPPKPRFTPLRCGLRSGTLELKASKESAHSDKINSVGFSPDGKTIVSGSHDRRIKVWGVRPFNASEWEEVDISAMSKDSDGEVKIDGLGYIKSNYWRNKVTGIYGGNTRPQVRRPAPQPPSKPGEQVIH